MNKTDFKPFSVMWTAASEAVGRLPSSAAVGMVFRALMEYDFDDIRRALDAHMKNPDGGQFAPKPADVIRYIDGDPSSRALLAWTKTLDGIAGTGSYQTVVFDDSKIMAVVEGMGGWITVCEVTEKELPFMKNEFVTRYKGFLNSKLERWPKKLIGITEAQNQKHPNAKIPEPILLGDRQKALEVFQAGGDKPRLSTPLSQALAQIDIKLINRAEK